MLAVRCSELLKMIPQTSSPQWLCRVLRELKGQKGRGGGVEEGDNRR